MASLKHVWNTEEKIAAGCEPDMKTTFRKFDMRGLYSALDAIRIKRGLTWFSVVKEINKPFEGTPSLPISVTTVRGLSNRGSVTSTVILQILRWLDRTPESFLIGNDALPYAEKPLPEAGPSQILRFDTRAIHIALDAERRRRGMTWARIAAELPNFAEGALLHLANGPLIGFPRVMLITQYLREPAASFVQICNRQRGTIIPNDSTIFGGP